MANIFIHSNQGDVHADAVIWGLGELGHSSFFWPSGKFPAEQGWSADISLDGRIRQILEIDGRRHVLPDCRTVWNRRGQRPRISDALDPQDAAFAEDESRQHMRALMRTVAPKAFWVNPPELAAADGFKPLQLRLAAEVGMRIPETLFSNDPDEIARFFRRLDGEVVHKCYRGHGWSLDGASDRIRAVNRTVAVLPEDLAQKAALAAAPGIFQRAIPKSYELRVTAMGRTLVAARIDSQKHESTREDWRSGYHELEIEPYTLPADIAAACRRYMQMSGLNFGCFDFIVTPDGVYYFLEVNQMGQFLWKERYCPDLPMLQIFCEFLAAADPAFEWREKTPDISFPAFFDSDAGAAYCA